MKLCQSQEVKDFSQSRFRFLLKKIKSLWSLSNVGFSTTFTSLFPLPHFTRRSSYTDYKIKIRGPKLLKLLIVFLLMC